MAITANNVQGVDGRSFSYTPANVPNALLVVVAASEDINDDEPITGVTFGATPLVERVNTASVGAPHANDLAVFTLDSPGPSAQTISVAGGETGRVAVIALTLGANNPVDQEAAVSLVSGATAWDTFESSFTPANDGLVVAAAQHSEFPAGNVFTPQAGTVEAREQLGGATVRLVAGHRAVSGGVLTSVGWTTGTAVTRASIASIVFYEAGPAAITGDLAADPPVAAAALSGEVSVAGTLTTSLPPLSATLTGVAATDGELASSLPMASVGLSGALTVTGDLAVGLSAPTTALSGTVDDGSGAVTGALSAGLPTLVAALSAGVTVAGLVASTLQAPSAAVTGDVSIGGDLVSRVPPPATALSGAVTIAGGIAGSLPSVAAAFTGSVDDGSGAATGTLSAGLPILSASTTGQVLPPAPQPLDVDAILNPPLLRVFGERFAGVQVGSGRPFMIDGVLDDTAELVDVGGRVGVVAGAPTLFVRLSSWPVGAPREGDQLVRQTDGAAYRVVQWQSDGAGGATLTLARQH